MTATIEHSSPPGPPPDPAAATVHGARRHRWIGGWRAALRLTWRDVLRHKGASLLIMIMVGLPVMIISGGAAVLATLDVSVPESLPVALGNAQATVTDERSGAVTQTAYGDLLSSDSDRRPRVAAGGSPVEPWTADKLARLTGGTVGATASVTAYAEVGVGVHPAPARVIGRAVLPGSGLAPLLSGRLPAVPGEVAVTPAGIEAGFPAAGPLRLAVGARTATATVVGVVAARGTDFAPVEVLLGEEWLPADELNRFLVVRDRPVEWAEIQDWNRAGLSVVSRAVVADPPAGTTTGIRAVSPNVVALVVVISIGLVLETALLAGPAFAVSAQRRRRTLALIASNGAEQGQLSRYVIAQGVVLGGVAVVLGAVVGTLLAWVSVRLIAWRFDGSATTIGAPPPDLFAWVVVLIVLVAFAAAVISAAIPGRRAARLDIADALAGRIRSGQVGRGVPVVGGGLMIIGGAAVAISTRHGDYVGLYLAGIGGAVWIIGALFLVPLLLIGLGRGLHRWPAAARIAGREVTRVRSRSVPAVAAVIMVVAVLTMIIISSSSDDRQSQLDYTPTTLPGQGTVDAWGFGSPQVTVDQIRDRHPDWTIVSTDLVGRRFGGSPIGLEVGAVPPGCTPTEAVLAPVLEDQSPTPCQRASANVGWSVVLPAPVAINPAARLSDAQREAFDQDTVLVAGSDLITDGQIRLALVERTGDDIDPSTGVVRAGDLRRVVDLPAVSITPDQLSALSWQGRGSSAGAGGAVMSAVAAERAGLPATVNRWEVVDPDGPISRADETALNQELAASLEVERGYESPIATIRWVLLGTAAALVAVAAVVTTALAQVEGRAEQATLAALGASTGFRRRVAAAQAALTAFLGAAIGVLLGLGPGIALAFALTTDRWLADPAASHGPIIVVPGWELVGLVVAVPLMAAVVGAAMVRRARPTGRRPT